MEAALSSKVSKTEGSSPERRTRAKTRAKAEEERMSLMQGKERFLYADNQELLGEIRPVETGNFKGWYFFLPKFSDLPPSVYSEIRRVNEIYQEKKEEWFAQGHLACVFKDPPFIRIKLLDHCENLAGRVYADEISGCGGVPSMTLMEELSMEREEIEAMVTEEFRKMNVYR